MGSLAGIEMFKEGKVDFGASDVPPTEQQIKGMTGGLQLIPVAAGSIVVSHNIPGVSAEVNLPREVLAAIFRGDITSWDDSKIADHNKTITLPKTKIVIVHRSGASGTTYVFTQHLSATSAEWKKKPGVGFTVDWPKDSKRAMGNYGVAETIKDTPGAIGYLSFNAAVKHKLPMAALQNKAGAFVAPTLKSAKASLAAVKDVDHLRDWVSSDAEAKEAYPIVTFTWILVRKNYDDTNAATQLKEFLKFALTKGQEESDSLGYVPLPAHIVDKILPEVERIGS